MDMKGVNERGWGNKQIRYRSYLQIRLCLIASGTSGFPINFHGREQNCTLHVK